MYMYELPEHREDFVWNASMAVSRNGWQGVGWVSIAWIPVGLLVANDIRKMKRFNRLLELPPQKSYHFFICKHAWPNVLYSHHEMSF